MVTSLELAWLEFPCRIDRLAETSSNITKRLHMTTCMSIKHFLFCIGYKLYFDQYCEYVNPSLHTLLWRYTNYNSDFRKLKLCINLSDTPPSVVPLWEGERWQAICVVAVWTHCKTFKIKAHSQKFGNFTKGKKKLRRRSTRPRPSPWPTCWETLVWIEKVA